jgi:hypothetical protein
MLIYIEHKGKVKKIPKPQNSKDLRDKFAEKFELPTTEYSQIYYMDSQNEEITIIDDEDYAISFDKPASNLKYLLRFEEKPKQHKESQNVSMSDLEDYSRFLESGLPVEKIAQVQSFMNQDYIPCYECLDFQNKLFPSEQNQWVDVKVCKKCNGSGRLPRKKMWSLILSLIDFKIKQFVVNPIKTQFQANNITNPDQSCDQSNMSEMPDICNDSINNLSSFGKMPERTRNTEMNRFSLMQLKTDNTIESFQNDNYSSKDKIKNVSSLYNSEIISLNPKRQTIHEENYEKKRLDFRLTGVKAVLTNNLIEVEIQIENSKNVEWPPRVHLRGDKTCEFTKNFLLKEPIFLGPFEKKKIDFCFQANESVMSSDKVALIFQFFTVDERAQIFYSSTPFKIKLDRAL